MKNIHKHDILQERIIAHFYMDDALLSDDLEEIKSCESCTKYYAQIKVMAAAEIKNEPDDHYWDHYFDRLEDRLNNEKDTNLISFFAKHKMQSILAAAMIILFLGFNLGKFLYQPINTNDVISNIDAMEIQNLVTRSKVLFTQFNQLDEFNARFFLEEQMDHSKDLLRLATYLRTKHEENPVLSNFIGDLEKVLISVKSIENEDIYTIKAIQDQLFQGQVLAKLEFINTREVE